MTHFVADPFFATDDVSLDELYKSRPTDADVNMDDLHDEWLAAQSSSEMRDALLESIYGEIAEPREESGCKDEVEESFAMLVMGLSPAAVAALCESNDVQGYESFDDWLAYRLSEEYEEGV